MMPVCIVNRIIGSINKAITNTTKPNIDKYFRYLVGFAKSVSAFGSAFDAIRFLYIK